MRSFIRGNRLTPLPVLVLLCTAAWASSPLKLKSPVTWNDRPAAAAAPDGTIWLAWTGFANGDDDIILSRVRGQSQTPASRLGSRKSADFSPRICVQSNGGVHVLWVGVRNSQFRILHSQYRGGSWTKETAVSGGPGKCLSPAIAAAGDGRIHAAWEATVGGNTDIYGAAFDGRSWTKPFRLTDAPEADCNPSLAVSGGKVWIAWDRCETVGYRVHFASLSKGKLTGQQALEFAPGHFRHPELASDAKGVWLACEGFRPLGRLQAFPTICLDGWYRHLPLCQTTRHWNGSRWDDAPADSENVFGRNVLPLVDKDGNLWVFYEVLVEKKFVPRAKVLRGGEWKASFAVSGDLLSWEHRPAACVAEGAVWAAFPSNTRGRGSGPFTIGPGDSHIYLARLNAPNKPSPSSDYEPAPVARIAPPAAPPVTNIEYRGERLNLYFGDLHKHSDISGCGVNDGTTIDNYRFWRDWRRLHFMMNADHSEHHDSYDWVKVRRAASLFTDEGHFAAYSGYEWTSEFEHGDNLRCGHYNPTFLRDGDNLPCLSASEARSNDPLKLWSLLQASLKPGDDVLTICHHSGRENAPLDWSYYDPRFATHIEIVQSRGSYEHWNCPDPQLRYGDTTRARGHFAQDGLARGYTYGFTGGGDHSGSQITGVFAPRLTKKEIFEALKSKRCYATNGEKIFLDFRVDGNLMGSDFESASGEHAIAIHAAAPSKIIHAALWRDGRMVKSAEPNAKEWRVSWNDESGEFRRAYYYARVMTEDGGIAWASPVWITHATAKPSVRVYLDSKQAELIVPRTRFEIPIVLRNDGPTEAAVKLALDLPEGWTSTASPFDAVTIAPGKWAEVKADIQAAPPTNGAAGLQVLRVRLEPEGSSLDEPALLVLNTTAGVEDAEKARELCSALHSLDPSARAEYLAGQSWLGDSIARFARSNVTSWRLSRIVIKDEQESMDRPIAAAGSEPGRLPDLNWRETVGELYLDDDKKLGYSVQLIDVRPNRKETEGFSYCVSYVQSPRARDAKLRVGSDGRYQVWVNGQSVEGLGELNGAKRTGSDASARLAAGWNQIVLRIERGRRFARFWMKVLKPDGEPFDDLRLASAPD